MGYVNIDLEMTPLTTESGRYKVSAGIKGIPVNALTCDRAPSEEISINLQEWRDLKDALESVNVRSRGIDGEAKRRVKEFGKSLFRQVIRGNVYTLYRSGKDYCRRKGHILRLRLHLGSSSPELIELPWELLCEEEGFLGLNTANPRILITRSPIYIEPIKTVERSSPLQIMLVTAEPADLPTDAEREKELVKSALREVRTGGYVSLMEVVGTDIELEKLYLNRTLDIFHFIGHGSFNKVTQEGELVLEDVYGGAKTIAVDKFSLSLPNSVKLVFLNACESARGNTQDPFSSIAYTLAREGRVVIAMQFQISSAAAVRFAEVFYTEIAKGVHVDEAVAEARHRVFTMADDNPLDWAAPVLYMKSESGVLFDII